MTKYRIEVADVEELSELPGSWEAADYIAVLEELGVDDAGNIAPEELRDMCLLALQDHEPPEAAAVLLKYKLGTKLTAGQIKNFSIESQHERLWEQSADLELHHRMFDIASLLNAVNEVHFPTPDAVRATFFVKSNDPASLELFNDSMSRNLLVNMLSAGMDESALLNRLFGDQIAAGDLPEADAIIWDVHMVGSEKSSRQVQIISSGYWLEAIRETESFDWESPLVTG